MTRFTPERATTRVRNTTVQSVAGGAATIALDGTTVAGVPIYGAPPSNGAKSLLLEQDGGLLLLPPTPALGVGGLSTAKQGGNAWIWIYTWDFPAWAAASDLALTCQLMGGFSSNAGDIQARIVVGSGLGSPNSTFPTQGTAAAAGRWTAINGGITGSIAANTACSLQLHGYTTATDGAYWSFNWQWVRR